MLQFFHRFILGVVIVLSGCATDSDFGARPRDYFRMAEEARGRGDIANAVHNYRSALKENPDCEKAYIGLGLALLDNNTVIEAQEVFVEACEKFPESPGSYTGLGIAYVMLDQPEKGLFYFEKALKLNPRYAKAMNGAGVALDILGRHVEAQASYKAALELEPNNSGYKNNLGFSHILSNNLPEAIRILETLARSFQSTPRIRQNLAMAYSLNGERDKARRLAKMDLSDEFVINNMQYLDIIRNSGNYGGLKVRNRKNYSISNEMRKNTGRS